MGTKKGQVRKTARRAYEPRRPEYTVTKTGNPYAPIEFFKGILFIPSEGKFLNMKTGKSRKLYSRTWWRRK